MDVAQVTSMNGLRTVTADRLDSWIMETLQPSTAFSKQVKMTVKQICDFLKEDCFEGNIHVHKTVKGGSAGKGTALRNNSDADVVLFLSCFSSYQEQKQERPYILDLIKSRLQACRQSLMFTVSISEPRYKGPGNTPRSLSLTLCSKETLESIEVDILPAYNALGQVSKDAPPDVEVYVGLLNASSGPGEFSPCFTELQKKFVKRYPAKLKNLLRLVKHWYKEMLKPQYPTADLPPKYALELLTIYAWEEGTGSHESFVMAEGFRTVLELLCRHREICIYWEIYYSLQHRQIGAHVKRLLRSPRPIILDPADPTGILGQGKDWDLLAQEAARHRSLPCVNTAQPWDVQPARPVTIEVRQLVGVSLSRTVSPGTTIWQLKEEIEQAWGIPRYRQRLAQQEPGRSTLILEDGDTLATHGIFYNTTLMLLQTEPQTMEVFVKDDKNRTTTYTVLPTDTVQQLKEQIHSHRGPPASQQRLTYGSRELEDRHTLAHYNIQPRSTIFMLLRLRGGTGPQNS
ncbi:2'-5'-oligoadenylate synthase 1-like [Falco biarmicus]|uniref:2'-5'-oligoadenylate synthase 1-like n=1 Tax=Falco peregrinus TaxID=8954 RepID=UPI00038719AD|nr:2'-5'-oligoadenylate synthase 1-like [Falco peregrinus]XP_005432791.1 2'-5'-oligoadenylate synthase 1-like [Falco cherrug]XP_037242989.1 2'-5'-oligoadenylate synthase 1-like [Falco rusticolus]XP_056193450.1 2'-5'-oligoadenylate synthase 1-like [Falco biarmicus]